MEQLKLKLPDLPRIIALANARLFLDMAHGFRVYDHDKRLGMWCRGWGYLPRAREHYREALGLSC